VVLQQVEIDITGVGRLGSVPEDIVVVRKGGEEDAEEEAGGWSKGRSARKGQDVGCGRTYGRR